RLTGLSGAQLPGRSFWEACPEAAGTPLHREYLRAANDRTPAEFDYRSEQWNRWLHVKVYPAPEGGISVFFSDITARRAAEEALRQSEERFRGVFESSAVGVAILTVDARFLQVNQAFCRITGYGEEELLSLDCTTITHKDDAPEMIRLIGELLEGKRQSFFLEKRYFTKSGRLIWVATSFAAMRHERGCPEHLIVRT